MLVARFLLGSLPSLRFLGVDTDAQVRSRHRTEERNYPSVRIRMHSRDYPRRARNDVADVDCFWNNAGAVHGRRVIPSW